MLYTMNGKKCVRKGITKGEKMNERNNMLKNTIKELEQQKSKIKKDTDIQIRNIIKVVMDYAEELSAVSSNDKMLRASRIINDNQDLVIVVSHYGQVISILLRTFYGEDKRPKPEKDLTIYVGEDKCSYTTSESYESSRKDILFIAKEASRLMSEDDSLMNEILSQVVDDLKKSIEAEDMEKSFEKENKLKFLKKDKKSSSDINIISLTSTDRDKNRDKNMDDNIKKLIKEIEGLKTQKKKVKEETDARVSEIVEKIMEYKPAFSCIQHSDQSIEETQEINPGQKITIRISHNGIKAFIQKYSNNEKFFRTVTSLYIYFVKGIDNSFEYEIDRLRNGSYNDVVLLAKKASDLITEPNGPVEEMLKNAIKNLENSIK